VVGASASDHRYLFRSPKPTPDGVAERSARGFVAGAVWSASLPAPASPCSTEREGTEIVENEPLANTPAQALDWFLRTKMDLLVMGDVMIRRE
jgi:hypothetical protein